MKQKNKDGYNLGDFGLLFSEKSAPKSAESKPLKHIFATKRVKDSTDSVDSARKSAVDSVDSAKNNALDSADSADSARKSALDSTLESALDSTKSTSKTPQSREYDFIYAPQFQGFDGILAQKGDFSAQNSAESQNNFALQNDNFNSQSNNFALQSDNFNLQNDDFAPQSDNFTAQTTAQSTQSTPTQSEKDLLLSHPHAQSDTNALFVAYSILFLMLLVFMPQVYLANNIYTSSKNINYLKSQKDALRDENSDLQKRLESVKFNFLTLEIEEIK